MSIFTCFSNKLSSRSDAASTSDLLPAGENLSKPKSHHPLDTLPWGRNNLVKEIAELQKQLNDKQGRLGAVETMLARLQANNRFWEEMTPGGVE